MAYSRITASFTSLKNVNNRHTFEREVIYCEDVKKYFIKYNNNWLDCNVKLSAKLNIAKYKLLKL